MEKARNVLILGGYGRTGTELARLLLTESRHNIGLAGRDPVKAMRKARELNWKHPGQRVRGVQVNVALKKQLVRAMGGYDLVVVSIPNTAFGEQIARAALEAGIDYIDASAGGEARRLPEVLDEQARESGLTLITQADCVHGAPYVMKRYLAGQFDYVHKMTAAGDFPSGRGRFAGALVSLWKALGLTWSRLDAEVGTGLRGETAGRSGEPSLPWAVKATALGVSGGADGRLSLTLEHRDPSLARAIAVLPTILGLLNGSMKDPGVRVMGVMMDPDSYLERLWDLGMTVSLEGCRI